jgi:hypothetical protein
MSQQYSLQTPQIPEGVYVKPAQRRRPSEEVSDVGLTMHDFQQQQASFGEAKSGYDERRQDPEPGVVFHHYEMPSPAETF